MRIVRTIAELRVALKAVRESGLSIGFVPTMGFLHEGHGALIRQSTARCDVTVVSVFVNPTQFGPTEDLDLYPRDHERDQNLCLRLGVQILFMPEPQEIYPAGFVTSITVGTMGDLLCGQFRPGHFQGVATVVAHNDRVPESLVRCADDALYRVKSSGRANFVVAPCPA